MVEGSVTATDPAALTERADIVAWLRDEAARNRAEVRRLHAMKTLTRSQTAEWEMLINLKSGIANAIEQGQHIPNTRGTNND